MYLCALLSPFQLKDVNQGCLLTSSIPNTPNLSPGFTLNMNIWIVWILDCEGVARFWIEITDLC